MKDTLISTGTGLTGIVGVEAIPGENTTIQLVLGLVTIVIQVLHYLRAKKRDKKKVAEN